MVKAKKAPRKAKSPARKKTKTASMRDSYSAEANALRAKIGDVRASVPELPAPEHAKGGGIVNDVFIEKAASILDGDEEVLGATGLDSEALRNGNRFVIAYGPIVDELEKFTRDIKGSVTQTKRNASAQALSVLGWLEWRVKHRTDPPTPPKRLGELRQLIKELKQVRKAKSASKGKTAAPAATQSAKPSRTKQTVTETVTEKSDA